MAYVVGTLHGQGFARIFATYSFSRNPVEHADIQAMGRAIVETGWTRRAHWP